MNVDAEAFEALAAEIAAIHEIVQMIAAEQFCERQLSEMRPMTARAPRPASRRPWRICAS